MDVSCAVRVAMQCHGRNVWFHQVSPCFMSLPSQYSAGKIMPISTPAFVQILVIYDDLRNLLTDYLVASGFVVDTACDGAEMHRRLAATTPDAIVKHLAHANGWSVRLEGREGGGLAAWVELPGVD